MDVLVKRSYRSRNQSQENNYNYSSSVVTVVEANLKAADIKLPEYAAPAIVFFSETDAPSVENYDIEYAGIYGEHPSIKLFVYDDDGNEQEVQQVPKRYRTDGALTKIAWDEYPLPAVCSGKIIISK